MSRPGLALGVGHETRWAHSLPFGVERTADRLLPPGARLADGPGCPPDRGRPMSGSSIPLSQVVGMTRVVRGSDRASEHPWLSAGAR